MAYYYSREEKVKRELREKAIKERSALNLQQISALICAKIVAMPEFIQAQCVAVFYPKDIEINLLPL